MPRTARARPRTATALAALGLALAAGVAVTAAAPRDASAQLHDPRLRWDTLETEHFRVHYYQGMRPIAERVAAIGEGIYARIGDLMGRRPVQVTEIVLTDHTDEANGSATAVPYNNVILYVTAPEDYGTLSDFDDWVQNLLTHEYTHIAHLDNISGIPAIINAILGKVYPPNNLTPRWILEGIATYSESRHTTGGRLRSSVWDMYLRADALENRLLTLDQVSNGPNRWPHGNVWYLYGSYFCQYLAERFGERIFADVANYYGGQPIPGGINRAIRRATGFTYEELYPQFLDATRARYRAQRDAIAARGIEQGERLTFQGEELSYPRFVPGTNTVAYQSNDGGSHLQIRTVDVGRVGGPRARPRDGDWVNAQRGFAFDRGGERMVLTDVGFHRGIYFYYDLYTRRAGLRPDGSLRADRNANITDGARASYPDVSPDDDHVTFSANYRSTQTLYEMSLTERRPVVLYRPRQFEQIFTPRYSPDGRQIVFSQWQTGGYRDIRILDRATGAIRDLTHDRAVDMHPVFTPDGRYVIWSSDRTGVANLYAYELATGAVRQVTNVVSGAFMPAISPDGRTLVYVGYHSFGHDLWRLPLDPSRWRDPAPEAVRAGERIPTPPVRSVTHGYNPWHTLRPRYWLAGIDGDGFGSTVYVTTQGSDVVGYHSYSARAGVGLVRGDPSFDFAYNFAGLRPNFHLHFYRTVTAANWRVGVSEPQYPVERWGGNTEISVTFPALNIFQSVAFSYEAQYINPVGGYPFGQYVDPNEPPTVPPFRGWDAGVRASWRFSSVQRYAYAISAQEGYDGFVGVHASDRALGSANGAFDVSFGFSGYVPMPWGESYRRRHVLALRLAGGLGISDAGPRGIFALGGFPTYTVTDWISSLASLSSSSGVGLRGYPQFARVGNQYYLANVEYRFPIIQIDRGPSTLPVYLSRIYGAAFMDVGNAFFGAPRADAIAVGVGFEALIDMVFAYYYPFTIRTGLARGLTGDDAIWNGYALFSSPF